jgi:aldehyde:ferredoxin oxidoreductase
MCVKEISLQNCDPRAEPAWGLLNATETYGGAAHIWCYGDLVHAMRHVGVRPLVTPDSSPRQFAEAVTYKQDLVAVLDSISICAFSSHAYDERDYCDALELIAGIEMTPDELLARGSDVIQLERGFNLLHGLRPSDDGLPGRFLRDPLPEGRHGGRRCDLAPMLDEYHALRQWDRDASLADDRRSRASGSSRYRAPRPRVGPSPSARRPWSAAGDRSGPAPGLRVEKCFEYGQMLCGPAVPAPGTALARLEWAGRRRSRNGEA